MELHDEEGFREGEGPNRPESGIPERHPRPVVRLVAFIAAVALSTFAGYSLLVKAQDGPRKPASTTFPEIHINTVPSGADVTFDGRRIGVSPQTIMNPPPGEHLIVAFKKDYRTGIMAVNLGSTEKKELKLFLPADTQEGPKSAGAGSEPRGSFVAAPSEPASRPPRRLVARASRKRERYSCLDEAVVYTSAHKGSRGNAPTVIILKPMDINLVVKVKTASGTTGKRAAFMTGMLMRDPLGAER